MTVKKRRDEEHIQRRRDIVAASVRRYHSKLSDIGKMPAVSDPDRRKKCGESMAEFARTYLPHVFFRPFSRDHMRIIETLERCVREYGRAAIGAPRGFGKTWIGLASILWATLYGYRRFTVMVGSKEELARDAVRDLQYELTNNDLLLGDFPEACYPFVRLEGRPQRAQSQTYLGAPTMLSMTINGVVMPTIPGSPCSGSVIRIIGITGSIRGLRRGATRPDFLFIDDPQTDETAASPQQTAYLEKTIVGKLLGLAGHDRQISAFMALTVIAEGDLACRFLDRQRYPDWNGEKLRLVYQWPTRTDLWDRYAELWREDNQGGANTAPRATEFYSQNRADMDAGAVVADDNLYDRATELSAIQHAWNLRLQLHDQFYAEYQNEPVRRAFSLYDITPAIVASRVNGLRKYEVPREAKTIVGFTDINRTGMRWCLCAFAPGPVGYVIAYGIHPERGDLFAKNASEAEIKRAVGRGIVALVETIAGLPLLRDGRPVTLRGFGVDRGWYPDVVHPVVRSIRAPFPLVPVKGFASVKYYPQAKSVIGRPGVNCHFSDSPMGQFLAVNVDPFKEAVQRGFLAPPGTVGSISLYGDAPRAHEAFASEICGEILQDKAEGARSVMYTFARVPGRANDFLDAVVGCLALNTWFVGEEIPELHGGNEKTATKTNRRRRERRKCAQEVTL